jgi:hypothetical protein
VSTDLQLDPTVTRRLGAGLLVAGAVWAVSPVHPPLPCPLRNLTGIPCPFCGLTRSVTALFRFDLAASLRFTPFGLVLVVAALVGLVALRGRNLPLRVPAAIVVIVVAMMWGWNLLLNPTFAT